MTNIPSAFCYNIKKTKAIVLGADPTNFSNHGKRREIQTVFGIGSGNDDYFRSIYKNLQVIGLDLCTIYVQNLVAEFQAEETGKNKNWKTTANNSIPLRIEEFKILDPDIPVLITAESIMKVLYTGKLPSASDIYSDQSTFSFDPTLSKLNRPLLPFYRHSKYLLSKSEWSTYKEKLELIFKCK